MKVKMSFRKLSKSLRKKLKMQRGENDFYRRQVCQRITI